MALGAAVALAGCGGGGSGNTQLSAGGDGGEGDDGAADSSNSSSDGSDAGDSADAGDDSSGESETGEPPRFDLLDGEDISGGGCESFSFEGEVEPPEIMLVLDKSGSMWSFPPWEFQGEMVKRWRSLHITVDTLLSMYQAQAYFGAELYPDRDAEFDEDESCEADNPITSPVALNNRDDIMASIPGIDEKLEGKTPTGDGVQRALAHLANIATDRRQAMILVADGDVSESCGGPNDVASVVGLLEDAAAQGVYTYVVGIGAGTGLDEELNQYAIAGGQPLPGDDKFYNAQDGDTLFEMMDTLVQGVLSCVVLLESESPYPDLTEVEIDGMSWPQVDDCASEDGWVYSNPYGEITLCGAACESLMPGGTVDITYQCPEG